MDGLRQVNVIWCTFVGMEMITLSELNNMVRETLEYSFTNKYWVQAEISELRESPKGYCFLEFVDKDVKTGEVYAKARGLIPRNIYPLLKLNFEESTNQRLEAGLKVLVQTTVSFHEVYGYSLLVHDIDSAYTLGSMALRRREIMERLEREGVASMNRDLDLPLLIKHVAIISSPFAAGYEDFCNQLDKNIYGLSFSYKLFPAVMQGNETEKSIIAALDSLAEDMDLWDVVVIIRGGGAVSDLNVFDSYALANHCAQFPIPVFTGIGHERDICVLDMVANRHFKTPTAVASFLIERMHQLDADLNMLELTLEEKVNGMMDAALRTMLRFVDRLDIQVSSFLPKRELFLQHLAERINLGINHKMEVASIGLDAVDRTLNDRVRIRIQQEETRLRFLDSVIQAYLPENILKKGYSLTLKNGKIVRNADEIKSGDKLETYLQRGKITSIVE